MESNIPLNEAQLRELKALVNKKVKVADMAIKRGLTVVKTGKNFTAKSLKDPGSDNNEITFYEIDKHGKECNSFCDWKEPREGGDAVKFEIYLSRYLEGIELTEEEAILKLSKENGLSVKPKNTRLPIRKENIFSNTISNKYDTLKRAEFKPVVEYLVKERGLTPEYIYNRRIGFDLGSATIITPLIYNGEVATYMRRFFPNYEEIGIVSNSSIEFYKENRYLRYKKCGASEYESYPFNYDSLEYEGRELYICEGIFDSHILTMLEKPNICTSGHFGDNEDFFYNFVVPIAKKFQDEGKEIVIVTDNDNDGRAFVKKWAINYLLPNGIYNFHVMPIPRYLKPKDPENPDILNGYFNADDKDKDTKAFYDRDIKDLNEFYVKNGYSLKRLYNNKINGLVFLAEYYKNTDPNQDDDIDENGKNKNTRPADDEFKKEAETVEFTEENRFNMFYRDVFCKAYRSYPSFFLLNDAIEKIKARETFSPEFLEKLEKRAKTPPSDKELKEAVIQNYDFINDEQLGLFYYDGRVWRKCGKEMVDQKIQQEMGELYNKGSRLKPIRDLIISNDRVLRTNTPFNKKNALVFENGTLYLFDRPNENGEYWEFKEEFEKIDYITYLNEYEYNEKALGFEWIKFLNDALEVRNPDGTVNKQETDKQVLMAQEYCGYLFFNSNIGLQKILVLIGDGRNGKGIFAHVIQNMFNPKLTTALDLSKLKENFQAIHLKDAIVNISGDSKSSLMGSEEIIKAISGGDRISDSYKGKDVITFETRCKLILSGNHDFVVKDTSDGLPERMLYLTFNNTYVEDPENRIETNTKKYKKEDINLQKRLVANEKPGVLNWMLRGYKRIKESRKFTLSETHKKRVDKFRDDNNSTRAFIKDILIPTVQTSNGFDQMEFCVNDSLYSQYTSYCYESGIKATSVRRFNTELYKALDNLGIVIERSRKRYAGKQRRFIKIIDVPDYLLIPDEDMEQEA